MSLLQNSNAISAGGYDLTNSLRFRASASAYLARIMSASGTTWTWSAWVKRGSLGGAANQYLLGYSNLSTVSTNIFFSTTDTFGFVSVVGGAQNANLTTTQVFRDPSAWYHLVFVADTTNATSGDRLRIYVNGVRATSFSVATYPAQNTVLSTATSGAYSIGSQYAGGPNYFDGYLDEVNFIDGQALTASSFGETDPVTGSWVAKKYTGTYGTNGFYLPFTHTEVNENRLTYSEDFANALWVKGDSTVTSNTTTAPDGTTTADTLTETATTALHLIAQGGGAVAVAIGQQYTISIYAKANTRSQFGVTLSGEGIPIFDLSSGTVINNGGYNTCSIQAVGNGWYRCSVTIAKTNTNGDVYYLICSGGNYSYLGNGTGSVYIWGAQLTYGPTLQSYIKTTTAAITNQGTTENKVLNSEDATNATWNKIGVTATANTTTAPNGTSTADSILETATTGLHVILPTTSLSLAAATIHTVSLYVKPINNQFIQLVLDDTATTNGGYANYDIVNGTVTASGNYGIGFGINASITSVGSGWYRISLSTSIGAGTTARFAINASFNGTTGLFPSYTGNASNGYYVWGMQVIESSTLGPYMPTTSSAQSKVLRIGADKSLGATGFGYNSWIANNISLILSTNQVPGSTYDAMIDVPTNTSATVANYCVLNPLDKAGFTIANGNLSVTAQSGASGVTGSIALPSSGKWYWECICLTGSERFFGVINTVHTAAQLGTNGTTQWVLYGTTNAGTTIINKDGTNVQTGLTAVNANNVIGIAYNADAGTIQFYNNNSAIGTDVSFTAGITYAPFITSGNNALNNFTGSANFGQQPFFCTPPTGFKALNTYNLPDSTILKGNRVVDATTYTGNGGTLTVTNAGSMKSDLLWVKSRSAATDNYLFDSIRGEGGILISNSTAAETVLGSQMSFNSNGFNVGSLAAMNTNGATYVGWQWQAGQGTNTTNTAGSVTSTVSANPTAGFSIATFTTPASGGPWTIGHGLGVAPKLIIAKARSSALVWVVYHASTGNTVYTSLNSTDPASASITAIWNNTSPTSTVFTMGATSFWGANVNYLAYCWAEIAGFSKFGSYTGNGSTDGPFVYLGFRPKFILLKNASAVQNWVMYDTSRNTFNIMPNILYANLANAEAGGNSIVDALSNGFKIRNTFADHNGSGNTIIYMAFAENPFKNSNAR
jgi:hypothetical protein